jgi:transposase
VIGYGWPIYVALEPVDLRLGSERLGALVRERMYAEPRSRALYVFIGKRGRAMKVLTWDGSGVIVIHKKLDAGRFELPRATRPGEQHLLVSDAIFEVIYQGVAVNPPRAPRRLH